MGWRSSAFGRLRLSFVTASVAFVAWEYLVNDLKAKAQLPWLMQEFSRIQPEPHNFGEQPYRMSKPELASVGAHYTSRTGCADVLSYFDTELARNGWRFVEEYSKGHYVRRYREADYRTDVECGG
jgi:hypothetical protein